MPNEIDALVEPATGDAPMTGGNGQGLEALYVDPLVKENAPKGGYKKHGFDTAHLSRYDGTDLVQWFGRVRSGHFYPYGALMRITPAGLSALRARAQGGSE